MSVVPQPPLPDHARDAAGRALRDVYSGVANGGPGAIAWEELPEQRRIFWRDRADQVVNAALEALQGEP